MHDDDERDYGTYGWNQGLYAIQVVCTRRTAQEFLAGLELDLANGLYLRYLKGKAGWFLHLESGDSAITFFA